jgi:hypothetical protein
MDDVFDPLVSGFGSFDDGKRKHSRRFRVT